MLKKREKQVLLELLKDGRIPDKHIAHKIHTTQPTVTRIRQKLERNRYIKKYRAVADYKKCGISVISITFLTWIDYSKEKERHEFMEYLKHHPEVMFLSRGEGLEGRTTVILSANRNFKDYEDFIREMRNKGGTNIGRFVQFIASPEAYKQFDSSNALIKAITHEFKESD